MSDVTDEMAWAACQAIEIDDCRKCPRWFEATEGRLKGQRLTHGCRDFAEQVCSAVLTAQSLGGAGEGQTPASPVRVGEGDEMSSYPDNITVTITVTMKPRWMRQFLGMLRYMQYLGSVGSSRMLRFYADGDGDFRPKFSWPADQDFVDRTREVIDDKMFDAG